MTAHLLDPANLSPLNRCQTIGCDEPAVHTVAACFLAVGPVPVAIGYRSVCVSHVLEAGARFAARTGLGVAS